MNAVRAGHFLVNVNHPEWGVWSVTVVSSSGAHIRSSSGERILDLGELHEWAQVITHLRPGRGRLPVLANPKTGHAYTFANLTQANNAVKKLGPAWHVSARYPFTVMFDASKLPANDLRGLSGLGEGSDRYHKVSDLPRSVQAALREVDYGRKDIEVRVRETFDPRSAGSGGRRGFVAACKMNDSGTYEIEWGSWGGPNPFTHTVESYEGAVQIPPDIAFVRGSTGGGHPTNASVYVSPRAMNPSLLTAQADVSSKEAKILAVFKGIKSSYRPEYLERLGATQREVDALVDRGFLSRNKAGSVAITTEGRNAADPRQPS